MVVERPGSAPQMMPRQTPARVMDRSMMEKSGSRESRIMTGSEPAGQGNDEDVLKD